MTNSNEFANKKQSILSKTLGSKTRILLLLICFWTIFILLSLFFCLDLWAIQPKSKSGNPDNKKAKDYKLKGLYSFYSNHNSVAIKYLKKSLLSTAEDKELCELVALAYLRQNDNQEAAFWFEKAKLWSMASFYRQISHPFEVLPGCESAQLAFMDSSYPFYPIVEVKMNNQSFLFLIDTGSSTTLVDMQLAHKLGINGKEHSQLVLSNGKQTKALLGTIESMSLGQWVIKNVPVLIVEELHRKSNGKECNFQGVLGMDFLSRFNLLLDYPARKVKFHRKNRHAAGLVPAGSRLVAKIPLLLSPQGLCLLQGKCNSKVIFFLFDTGSRDYPLEFYKESSKEFKFSEGSSGYLLDHLHFGSITIHKAKGIFTSVPFGISYPAEIPFCGIIGNSLFHRYKVLLDFDRMVMELFL